MDIARLARSPWEAARALLPERFRPVRVLNEGRSTGEERSATEVARGLRLLRAKMKANAIVNGRVDYGALADTQAFAELATASGALRDLDLMTLDSDDEKIAFFVNIYNVLSIDGVVTLGIKKSVMEVPSFFGTMAYRIGGHVLTLDDIENGVLRCNGPHPATGKPLFEAGDPRLSLCPTRVDPRIHSALVCASTSCPPFAFYDPDRLDAQLRLATEGYVEADVRVLEDARTTELPITFHYYRSDWGDAAAIYAFLLEHAHGTQKAQLERAATEGFGFEYQRYDWSLNSVA